MRTASALLLVLAVAPPLPAALTAPPLLAAPAALAAHDDPWTLNVGDQHYPVALFCDYTLDGGVVGRRVFLDGAVTITAIDVQDGEVVRLAGESKKP